MVESTIALIQRQLAQPDKMYDKVDAKLQELRNCDIQISMSSSAHKNFDLSVQTPYLTAVANHLQSWFPCSHILDSFSISDPKLLPECDERFCVHGDEKLAILLQHYSDGPLLINGD